MAQYAQERKREPKFPGRTGPCEKTNTRSTVLVAIVGHKEVLDEVGRWRVLFRRAWGDSCPYNCILVQMIDIYEKGQR